MSPKSSPTDDEGRGSAAQIAQLFAAVAQQRLDHAILAEEFRAYRSRTDAEDTAAIGNEDHRPLGDWRTVGEIVFLTGRCNSTIHKWIRRKKVRVHQPNGPRTAILIDIDNLPPGVSRSVNSVDGHTAGG
jgi:hypothetical protein